MDTSTVLSRLQFGFTLAYHYLFPQFTMGLALLLVILKVLYLWRKDERFNVSVHFWGKIFAVTFIVGVVTGIPMEFQFGTNWARFSAYAGDIIAQTLAMEGAFAFFLESAFLGLFLFGERAFGQRMHLFSAIMVWLGTWASGGFIIASNAWMQHPVGYTLVGNKLQISNYWAVLFNSWLLPQYMHTMSAAVVTASFVMAGLGAYYLLSNRLLDYGRIFVTLGVVLGLLASVFQLYPSGDLEGRQITQYQPVKLAAMEGLFKTEQGAELVIIGQPDVATGQLDNAIVVPYALSFLSYRRWTAQVKGINDFPVDQRPDAIELLYYNYHVMVGLGTFFVGIMGLAMLLLLWGKRLFTMRWMLWLLLLVVHPLSMVFFFLEEYKEGCQMTLKVRELSEEEELTIKQQVHSRTLPAWKVTRAKIIWYAKQGEKVPDIAKRLELCEKTTRLWLKRFNELGIKGLEESPRSGRPAVYPPEQIAVVIQTAVTRPEELDQPFASWTLDRLETYINEVKGIPIKRSRISEIFLAEGLGWRHEETWFGERVDPDFAEKRGPSKRSTPPRPKRVW